MNQNFIHVLLIWMTFQILTTHSFNTSSNLSNEKPVNQNNTELNSFKTTVICNKTSFVVNFHFREPFFGVIYANQIFSSFASECRSYGNGSEVIHFVTNSRQCGVNSIENQSDYKEYELVLYVQNDRNIQQASDQKIQVKCSPQELLLTGVVPNRGTQQSQQTSKFNGKSLYGGSYIEVHRMLSHNFTLSHISDALECRMDVMKGRIPFLKPIDGFVDLGQDVTVMIKIRQIDGIESMISRCYAHEGSHIVKQELTNNDGCSIDTNILPNFQLMPNPPSDFKVYFTTFPAFKFPDKTNLNIQCTVFICNTTCPQIQCDNTRHMSPPLHRIKRSSNTSTANRTIIMDKKLTALTSDDHNNHSGNGSSDSPLTATEVFNSTLLPNGNSIDSESHKTIASKHKIYINDSKTQCLTSQVFLLFVFVLIFSLISTLTITSFCGHKIKGINQKLFANNKLIHLNQDFSKGKIAGHDNQNSEYKTFGEM